MLILRTKVKGNDHGGYDFFLGGWADLTLISDISIIKKIYRNSNKETR